MAGNIKVHSLCIRECFEFLNYKFDYTEYRKIFRKLDILTQERLRDQKELGQKLERLN
jgi:hypothetical protein